MLGVEHGLHNSAEQCSMCDGRVHEEAPRGADSKRNGTAAKQNSIPSTVNEEQTSFASARRCCSACESSAAVTSAIFISRVSSTSVLT